MNHHRTLALLLAAVLLLGLFAGCAKDSPLASSTATSEATSTASTALSTPSSEPSLTIPVTTEPEPASAETTVPDPGPEEEEAPPIRWQNGGERSYLPQEPLTIPKLSEMQCEQMDVAPLIAKIKALTEKAADCDDAEELLRDFYELHSECYHFWTMGVLSCIRWSQDYANEETYARYEYYSELDMIVSEELDALFAALADNPCRASLEQTYFGEGFFDDHDDHSTASEAYLQLAQQEEDLLDQYYELAAAGINMYDDAEVDRKHDVLAQIFVELVKVRNQIAVEQGYENYIAYCYPMSFDRDYTPAQAREFLDQVQTCLVPLAQYDAIWAGEDGGLGMPYNALERLSKVAQKLGGPIWEAFRFMEAYELCDVSHSSKRIARAYTNYLYEYEAPVIFINGGSYTTLSHEFGHFVDLYYNNEKSCMDIMEIYSQVMEYLYLTHEDVDQTIRERNTQALLAGFLTYSILQECAYADFELQVYALAPEELTAEIIDAIFYRCMKTYGLTEGVSGKQWIGYHHFFDQPGYVISYATSAVATLEICAMDFAEPGAGVEAFNRLLDRTHGKRFLEVLEEAGLDHPFEAATLNKIAAFFKQTFHLE